MFGQKKRGRGRRWGGRAAVFSALIATPLALCSAAAGEMTPFRDGDTVVFFGDSITHGGRYHEFLTDYYRTRFPEADIRFVNSGIGGDNAKSSQIRIPEDIGAYAPTHVFVHFGMNDVGRSVYSAVPTAHNLEIAERCQAEFRRNLPELVGKIRQAVPSAKLAYLTPTPYDDTAVVTNIPPGKTGWATVNNRGCSVGLALMAGYVLTQARRDGVPCVDWYTPLQAFLMGRRARDPHYMITRYDRTHPEALGHSVMSWKFLEAQGAPSLVSDIAVDAAALKVTRAENAEVGAPGRTKDGLAFAVRAKALPFPVPPEALPFVDEFGVEEKLNREVLSVTGLSDGVYALRIDGVEVGAWTAAELARGVRLGFNPRTPQYRQAQEVMAAVAALTKREAALRNHHSARWFFGNRGAPVDDVAAFETWFGENVKDKGEYFAGFVPGYLAYWPRHREVRAALLADQRDVRKLALPRVRNYEILKAKREN